MIVQVAVTDHPLRKTFDYLIPQEWINQPIEIGMRVKVPWRFGNKMGVILALAPASLHPPEKLREVIEVLDKKPLLSTELITFCEWASHYYHHPIGQTIALSLPPYLRQHIKDKSPSLSWVLTDDGRAINPETLDRSPLQKKILSLLQTHPEPLTRARLKAENIPLAAIQACLKKGWISLDETEGSLLPVSGQVIAAPSPLVLNAEQTAAATHICSKLNTFTPFVLEGITGSGKTEVYLQVMATILSDGQQILVLIPEIGLTPQTVSRFKQRFPTATIALFHSRLSQRERLSEWKKAQSGEAQIILGTRSALFTPLPRLALIIVDEAHDLSFKQQEGLRYSARDLALKRAQLRQIPVILGSATHAFETLLQVRNKRFTLLQLTQRAGVATLPTFEVVDLRTEPAHRVFSHKTELAIETNLRAGNQVLVFINRRGYAPTLFCHDCRWIASCRRCDAKMTLHKTSGKLRCHHCSAAQRIPLLCPNCHSENIYPVGAGTEKIAEQLQTRFPQFGCLRIDRDTAHNKATFDDFLMQINTQKVQLLIGTQMLAKGHHFPHVTLVVILNIDHSLCSSDFHASEHLGQLITQVAGRAGRENKAGHVVLETHFPDHPLLRSLLSKGYSHFAQIALREREQAGLPPYSAMAILRVESADQEGNFVFLETAKDKMHGLSYPHMQTIGPLPALMSKRAGQFRAILILQLPSKQDRHDFLTAYLPLLEKIRGHTVRWHIDVDPVILD